MTTTTRAVKHVLGPKTIERLTDGRELPRCDFHAEYGLTYQKCRSCEAGWGDVPHLFKYAVRHYICEDCLTHWRRR